MSNFIVEELEKEFLNGNCAALAKKFNSLYGYEIFHIVYIKKEYPEDEDNGIIHTLVKIDEDKFIDASGVKNFKEIIKWWYYEKNETFQTADIFMIYDDVSFMINNKNIVTKISSKQFNKYISEVNYDYNGKYNLEEVCSFLLKKL